MVKKKKKCNKRSLKWGQRGQPPGKTHLKKKNTHHGKKKNRGGGRHSGATNNMGGHRKYDGMIIGERGVE